MRRPIFAHSNRIMRKDVNDRELHDSPEPDRWLHVIGEDQETRAVRAQFRQREAVADRPHRVLADAEMKIAGAVVVALEITGSLESQPSLRRGREVSGAAEQPR